MSASSEMTALRDAIAHAVGPAADAILAMPEMRAIKRWMNWAMGAIDPMPPHLAAAEPELPDAVIEWMVKP